MEEKKLLKGRLSQDSFVALQKPLLEFIVDEVNQVNREYADRPGQDWREVAWFCFYSKMWEITRRYIDSGELDDFETITEEIRNQILQAVSLKLIFPLK